MNWIAELHDLYERNAAEAGRVSAETELLLPLYHTTVNAHITVTVDKAGNFITAEAVAPEDKQTLIPVTEKSASRTAGVEPHPLCDGLKYAAGDYGRYTYGKDCSENHRLYMEQLGGWVHSAHRHDKTAAIYSYLQQGTLMEDLIRGNVLKPDAAGKVPDEPKIGGVAQPDAVVRFRVEDNETEWKNMLEDTDGRYYAECWKDRTLQQCYIAYCRAQEGGEELSYLTGRRMKPSYLQPRKIRNDGDGAKLISCNDTSNFTFKGRFANKEEAFVIGYEDSQKAHNALKWIIRKQGSHFDSLYFVTWESNLEYIPGWQKGADEIETDLIEFERKAADADAYDSEEDDPDAEVEVNDTEDETMSQTGAAEAVRFRRAVWGYGAKLPPSSKTMIMMFDAATTGRLAMLECREYASSGYLERIQDWHARCCWRHQKKRNKGKETLTFYGMVGIRDAAELLYGTEQDGYLSMRGKEECYKDVVKRWMPCILERRDVPEDMVRLAVRRASSPMSFHSRFVWERILSLACSLVRQQYKKRYEEEWTMALDEACTRRDYLYGRLLALADRIEYRTYEKDDKGDKGRQTNAKRYMCAFSQHPYRTWKLIEEKLEPYLVRLGMAERLTYVKLLDEICSRFAMEDYEDDKALSGLYLLGFHNQAYDLRKKKEEERNDA